MSSAWGSAHIAVREVRLPPALPDVSGGHTVIEEEGSSLTFLST